MYNIIHVHPGCTLLCDSRFQDRVGGDEAGGTLKSLTYDVEQVIMHTIILIWSLFLPFFRMGLAVTKQEAFWEACGYGHTDRVKAFIEEGIDVNWISYTVSTLFESLLSGNRENSYPSGPAQNEHNNKPRMVPLVPGARVNDIIWRSSKCLCFLQISDA